GGGAPESPEPPLAAVRPPGGRTRSPGRAGGSRGTAAAGPWLAPGRGQRCGAGGAIVAPRLCPARADGAARRGAGVRPSGMILDMLRHGETERGGGLRGSLDDRLTEQGWAQMREAVAQAGPWDALVSSPLRRCAQFADELGARLGLPVQLEAGVRELHFGDWEGRSA